MRGLKRVQRDFNEVRPHEALGQRPPASIYVRSSRSFTQNPREPDYSHLISETRSAQKNGTISRRSEVLPMSPVAQQGSKDGSVEMTEDHTVLLVLAGKRADYAMINEELKTVGYAGYPTSALPPSSAAPDRALAVTAAPS